MPIFPGTGVAPNRDSFSRSYVISEFSNNAAGRTYFADEYWTTQQRYFRELADSSLGILWGCKLDDAAIQVSIN